MRGRRGHRRRRSLIPLAAATTIALSCLLGLTNANTVPATRAAVRTQAITANTLKPTECAGITLTNLVVGSGRFGGTPGNDLILGSNVADTIDGGTGNDCILGGDGNDKLTGGTDPGGGDTDVCIGGPGNNDQFTTCEITYQ